MKRIAKFKKVSFDQFMKDSKKLLYDYGEEEMAHVYASIMLPRRATSGSAGYDFYTPYEVALHPHDKIIIPSGIRCEIEDGYMMLGVVRSSMGIKNDINLSNTCMVLDSDYFFADNEGHIIISLENPSSSNVQLPEGKAFCQGIVVNYEIPDGAESEAERSGGFGSTDSR